MPTHDQDALEKCVTNYLRGKKTNDKDAEPDPSVVEKAIAEIAQGFFEHELALDKNTAHEYACTLHEALLQKDAPLAFGQLNKEHGTLLVYIQFENSAGYHLLRFGFSEALGLVSSPENKKGVAIIPRTSPITPARITQTGEKRFLVR